MKPEQAGRITYRGPDVDDSELFDRLPAELQSLLVAANGFILFDGGLHVRGACFEPGWHSLRVAVEGDLAFHSLYEAVDERDVPFAQDIVGDQFLLRSGRVLQLMAETGELEELQLTLEGFLEEVRRDPQEFLCFGDEHELQPGELLHAFPPFCVEQSAGGDVSLQPVAADQVILAHAELAREIAGLEDGQSLQIRIRD